MIFIGIRKGKLKRADHLTPIAIHFGKIVAKIYFGYLRYISNSVLNKENLTTTDYIYIYIGQAHDDIEYNKKYNKVYLVLAVKILDILNYLIYSSLRYNIEVLSFL